MVRPFVTAQVLGLLLCLLPVSTQYISVHTLLGFALLQGCAAAAVSVALGMPRWWHLINLCFFPAVVVALSWHVPPAYYLLGLGVLVLVFWNTVRERVPLYLSNRATLQALSDLIQSSDCKRFMDAGSGTGTVVAHLARRHPEVQFFAVENAPLPWLLGRLRTLFIPNVETFRGSFWSTSFRNQDLVYAFLSPEPMQRLWKKCQTDLGEGAWLVSNSFQIMGVEPIRVVQLDDRRKTSLYLYACAANTARSQKDDP